MKRRRAELVEAINVLCARKMIRGFLEPPDQKWWREVNDEYDALAKQIREADNP